MKITIPVFWHDKTAQLLEDLNIAPIKEDAFEDCETRDLTFYMVTAIYKYEGGEKYTTLLSNGEIFIINLPFKTVESLIDNSIHYEGR